MTDKELLELAAKAAGYEVKWSEWRTSRIGKFGQIEHIRHEGFNGWNPLTDDGDALRLAVKLRFDVCTEDNGGPTHINVWPFGGGACCSELVGNDPYAATRLAIVRAAAEIGKWMK